MKQKTTSQIKKNNDSSDKVWVETSDVIRELSILIENLENNTEIVRKESKTESIEYSEIWSKIKEISQRVNNLSQSNNCLWKKVDKNPCLMNTISREEFSKFKTEIRSKMNEIKEETNQNIFKIWDKFVELNDRIRILENGKKIEIK